MADLKPQNNEKLTSNDADIDTDSKHHTVMLKRLAKHLDLCCLKNKTITYLEAADAIDVLAPQRIHQTTLLLETLIEHDYLRSQPIRAALVVSRNKTGLPGEGFFLKAQSLGLMSDLNAKEFHQQCLNNLFDS